MARIPWIVARSRPERIVAGVAEAVPVAHGEAQMFGHGLVADALAGIVVLERKRVVRIASFEWNAADAGKVFAFSYERRAHEIYPNPEMLALSLTQRHTAGKRGVSV